MSWFADLAGKAENLLNNLDEQTGAALRNHNTIRKINKHEKHDYALQPEANLAQKKRPIPRNLKKVTPITETRLNYIPSRKPSPTLSHNFPPQLKHNPDNANNGMVRNKKSPTKKNPVYNLNNCPKTMVCDMNNGIDQFGLRHRRYSLPSDLDLVNTDSWTYKLQNLEVENVMLKNEINVMNRETSELVERLRKTEDGNNVVNGSEELSTAQVKLEHVELENQNENEHNRRLTSQLEQSKHKVNELIIIENTYKDSNQTLQTEITLLKDANNHLEERIIELNQIVNEKELSHLKLETDLRHAQSTISDLQSNLEKSTAECLRLEKDWETYKLRVKSMLFAKDNEIKALQEGMNMSENTKMLVKQLESLREERDELSDGITGLRTECNDMKESMQQMEQKHVAASRVVAALRDALKDERAARNRAEAQCNATAKELKAIQIETGQTIAGLRTALGEKESELNHLRDTSSCTRTTNTSALNVADYDVTQDSIDNEKIQYLTRTLVQRQGKIDKLLADNNILKIQLDKLESKYKSSARGPLAHSVVVLQDEARARRPHAALGLRVPAAIRRHSLFRVFIMLYMICLHLWVITVLLSSTPENYVIRPVKS